MVQVKPIGKQLDIVSVAASISSDATAIGSIATGIIADVSAVASFNAEYSRLDGTTYSADINMGAFSITNVANVDGRDVSVDGTTQDTHIADTTLHRVINDVATGTTDIWSATKITNELALKSDRVVGATSGNIATLDTNGNLVDSGTNSSTFAASSHTHLEADITDIDRYTVAATDALLLLKANVATPVFTGTVGFPIYTMATLPPQAAGHQIYVSDAVGSSLTGTLCFSNGTTWIDVTTGIAVV